MPMPHDIQMQLIKKRLRGKEGKCKLQEIDRILQELPGWNTGPYGEIKKWLKKEAANTKTKSKIKHQDWLGVKRQGDKQFVLVGLPSVGKSSLIKRLCGLQTKVADYEFTTLKPIPGVVEINGAQIQLVDLPGLIAGASEDAGGGRRLLSIVRDSDGILFMVDLSKPIDDTIMQELQRAGIDRPLIVIGNKVDVGRDRLKELQNIYPKAIGISTVTGEGIEQLKNMMWKMCSLIRIYTRGQQLVMKEKSTVKDLVEKIHTQMLKKFRFARVTGKSTKFENQQVGLQHELLDEDRVEVICEN